MYKIKDIRRRLLNIGLDFTADQIRSYEKKGLFSSTRDNNGYRRYDGSQVNEIVTLILLHKVGYTIDEIKKNRKNLIALLGKNLKELACSKS